MQPERKAVRIGLNAGDGPPPGYLWHVSFLTLAHDEAQAILDQAQYAHVVDEIRALASENDPTRAETVSVDAIETYYELRMKGGALGKINLRVFFTVLTERRRIVILGVIKKEAEGQTPVWAKVRTRVRLRRLLAGEFGIVA